MSNRIALRDRALAIALTQVGVTELGGPNTGPEVDRYLASVGLGPGHQWCCAFVLWCYTEAARELAVEQPLPRTGRVARLWSGVPDLYRSATPSDGAIFVHLAVPGDLGSIGHTGIVVAVERYWLKTVEGNSNSTGSRLGDRVVLQRRPRGFAAGFIDVGREGPAPAAELVT